MFIRKHPEKGAFFYIDSILEALYNTNRNHYNINVW